MNIDKALEHFEWKFKNTWKPTKKDIEAYNSILDYKDTQESINMSKNESLTKLWIHQLMLFARTGLYTGETSIQTIDKILEKSVYEWCLQLKEEIPMMRFGAIGNVKYPLEPKDYYNMTKLKERREKIITDFETELTKELKHEITEDNIIKFVEKQITRTLNKFEK